MMKLVSFGAVIGLVVCSFASSAPAATESGSEHHVAPACFGAGHECGSSSECCGTMMCKLGSSTTKQFCTRR